MRIRSTTALIASMALIGCTLCARLLSAQNSQPGQQMTASDEALKANFQAEHEIGRRFRVDASNLPTPKSGAVVTNRPLILPYTGQQVQVPPGFTAAPFATGLANPRRLLVLPNGDVILAEQSAGYLTLLRDSQGTGRADFIERHVEDLNRPYGLAWRDGYILITDQDGIWRVPHQLGALRAGRSEQQKVAQVPPEQRKPVPTVRK